MTALNCLCWCQYFVNHVMKQLQNVYLIILKDLVLQIFKYCWIWGISDPKKGMHSWLFDFFSSIQMALWDFQLVYAIPFISSLGIWALSENFKLFTIFFHTERCQLWYDSLGDLISLNHVWINLIFCELLTFLVCIFHCNWGLNIIILVTGEHRYR